MNDRADWETVAKSWERVFDDVADLGRSLADSLREGYEARADAEAAFSPSVHDQVGRGLDATKAAFSELVSELTERGRGADLSREAQSAIRTTVDEIGVLFRDLASRMGPATGEGEPES